MWPCSRLVTAERDGYFEICLSLRPNPGLNEVYQLAPDRGRGGCDKNMGDRKMHLGPGFARNPTASVHG